ncbi:hypothetical protein HYH02_002103 [Chlamydomonas schloesseri]|uniref:Uncharacterized protein n=1 Tax=Chlamydomonas schloesseri TaxID=2026947 RepID=A0A835WTW1_9CHLO|nr:hypothetical protein HYH02_002103 [Chlamydomonas schloesseri]|eukprot:KAG2453897.1 hypothetical protein HYH02_002103 [Chlamydomonas schloesseri]
MRRSAAAALCALTAVLAFNAADARKASIVSAGFGRQLLQQQTCPNNGNSQFCQDFFRDCARITCSGGFVNINLLVGTSGCKTSTYSWAACVKQTGAPCGPIPTPVPNCNQGSNPEYCNNVGTGTSSLSYAVDPSMAGTSIGIQSFLNQYGCIAKSSGKVNYTLPNISPPVTIEVPVYPPIKNSTYSTLDAFFSANPATGTGVGMACYTDTTYSSIAFYLYIQKEDTPTENRVCETCKFYSVNQVSSCLCGGDTAWAIPIASVMESLPAGSTAEQLLTSGYPGAQVFWNPRTDDSNRNAWGGFFRILPAASGNHDTSIEYIFDVCAGCGQNRVGKGFIFGRIKFQITHIKGNTSISTFLAPANAPNAIGSSSVLHMFQSFRAPASLSPGQFQRYTVTSAVPATFTYGQTWTVSKVNTGTFKVNGADVTVLPYDPTKGLYVAIHLTVSSGGFCPSNLPAPVQP